MRPAGAGAATQSCGAPARGGPPVRLRWQDLNSELQLSERQKFRMKESAPPMPIARRMQNHFRA